MIRLITHWYDERNAERRSELKRAVLENEDNPHVTEFFVLDMTNGPAEFRFPTVLIDHRPTFTELVSYGAENLEWVNVLINTDCYLRQETTPLLERVEPDQIFCISRTDNHNDNSQDCWAWRGRLNVDAPFPLGLLGCDNRFAKLCMDAGRKPLNPCLSIKVEHLHKSDIRRYSEETRVRGDYYTVLPCAL